MGSIVDCGVLAIQQFPDELGDFLDNDGLVDNSLDPDLPVILMSGLEATNIEARAKRAGVRRIINKPIVIKEIAELIRELLNSQDAAFHN